MAEAYPDVEFIELLPTAHGRWDVWGRLMPLLFYRNRNATLVLTQLDMIYTRQLGEFIDDVQKTNCLYMNDDLYGWDMYLGEDLVWPRIWEGGLIVQAEHIVSFMEQYNIGLGFQFHSCFVDKVCKQLKDYYLKSPWKKGKNVYMPDITSGPCECLYEFCLLCYHFGIQMKRPHYLAHFPRPESLYLSRPDLYRNINYESIAHYNGDLSSLAGSLFMYYMSGVTSWHPVLARAFHAYPWVLSRAKEVSEKGQEWLDPVCQQRLSKVLAEDGPKLL